MEIKVRENPYGNLNLDTRVQLYIKSQLTIEKCKWYYDTKRATLAPATIKYFRQICAKLETVIGVEPNDEQKRVLDATWGFAGAIAINQIADSKTSVCTENVISFVCMGSQIEKFNVEFVGGPTPSYVIHSPTLTKTPEVPQGEYPELGRVGVVGGVPFWNRPTTEAIKNIGAKTIAPVHPLAANIGSFVGIAFQFNSARDCQPRNYIPAKVSIPGTTNQMLTTEFADWAMGTFHSNPASAYGTASLIASQSDKVVPYFNRNTAKLGLPLDSVKRVPLFQGRTLHDLPVNVLKKYYREGYDQLGKAKDLVRNADTGYSSMNAPLKWRMPLEICSGNPDRPGFKKRVVISYWGAGGSRARRMFERRGQVVAYDLQPTPVVTKKVTKEDFAKFKIYDWIVKDIFQHQAFDPKETLFVSDIYIDHWGSPQSTDPHGHKFVSGIIRGQIVNGDNVTCSKMPTVRLVKGFLPEEDEMVHYEKCYPFFVFRVCRPLTSEIIYLKADTQKQMKYLSDRCNDVDIDFGGELVKRSFLITNAKEYSEFVRACWICVCEELNFQQRRVSLDPRDMVTSPYNRKWNLSALDLPCLFVPKHMRGGGISSADVVSSFFEHNVLGISWNEQDAYDLVAEAHNAHAGDGNDSISTGGSNKRELHVEKIDLGNDDEFD